MKKSYLYQDDNTHYHDLWNCRSCYGINFGDYEKCDFCGRRHFCQHCHHVVHDSNLRDMCEDCFRGFKKIGSPLVRDIFSNNISVSSYRLPQ